MSTESLPEGDLRRLIRIVGADWCRKNWEETLSGMAKTLALDALFIHNQAREEEPDRESCKEVVSYLLRGTLAVIHLALEEGLVDEDVQLLKEI